MKKSAAVVFFLLAVTLGWTYQSMRSADSQNALANARHDIADAGTPAFKPDMQTRASRGGEEEILAIAAIGCLAAAGALWPRRAGARS